MILKTANLKNLGKKHSGKVRDYYLQKNKRILITTDRISAFDVNLGYVPEKGQVLNLLSEFWFKKTKNIIQNHMISVPHPNVMVVKNVKLIPIEMVVRGYMTGVTGTSIWGSYEKGDRVIYGIKFPDGLFKNQKLKKPVITPTTKAEVGHDMRLTEDEILKRKIVSTQIWKEMKKAAVDLFDYGTKIASRGGLILVDTKYEFGTDENNNLILIDEIHTPDSSRFWIKNSYKTRVMKGLEPENFDKEFMRMWYKEKGYIGNGITPVMTKHLINQIKNRYIAVYEMITGEKFTFSRKKISL